MNQILLLVEYRSIIDELEDARMNFFQDLLLLGVYGMLIILVVVLFDWLPGWIDRRSARLSHKWDHNGGGARFKCDESGCGETFLARANNIKAAWQEAEQFGWRMTLDHDPISKRCTFCPSHAKLRLMK